MMSYASRPLRLRTIAVEEEILHSVEHSPDTSKQLVMKQVRSLYGCVWCPLLLFLLEPPSCFSRPQAPDFAAQSNIKLDKTLLKHSLARSLEPSEQCGRRRNVETLDTHSGRQSQSP
uniref:Uncharacterized protein n=1 Tax=Timema genevievae TaxID=629358 RepID=A0A7R9K2I8_TIMGE|nr:unnamed protein product [Timema genevievae]